MGYNDTFRHTLSGKRHFMNYESLKEFITRLESEGELVRIAEPVSPILEIAEITDRVSKSPDGGKLCCSKTSKAPPCRC